MIKPSSAPSTRWQPIRAKILHRACTNIAKAVANGSNVRFEVRRLAKKLHGRILTRNPRKLLDASAPTLNRIYYMWVKAGRTMESLHLGYRNATPHRITPAMVKRWMEIYLAPGTTSKESAYRQAKRELRIPRRPFPSFATFCRIGGPDFQAKATDAKRSRQHRYQVTANEDERVQEMLFLLAETFPTMNRAGNGIRTVSAQGAAA